MRRYSICVVLISLALGLVGPASAAPSATRVALAPTCPDPPQWEWNSPPSLSGGAVVAYKLTSTSGNVSCASTLTERIYRTDSAGNPLSTLRTMTWTCADSLGDCAESDLYPVTSESVGYYIKVTWTASNSLGSTSNTAAQLGPITATGAPPSNTAVPVLTGEFHPGQGECYVGGWSGAASFQVYSELVNVNVKYAGPYPGTFGPPGTPAIPTTTSVGYYIRCRVVAIAANGSRRQVYSAVGATPVDLNSITYDVYVTPPGGTAKYYGSLPVRYPGCALGALCTEVRSGVELQTKNGPCFGSNVTASGWTASGGLKSPLSPYIRGTFPSGGMTDTATGWSFASSAGTNCPADLGYQVYEDQGSATNGLSTGPPLSVKVQLSYGSMALYEDQEMFVPAIWLIGDYRSGYANSWIEVGFYRGNLRPNSDPQFCFAAPTNYLTANVTYLYLETVTATQGGNHGPFTCTREPGDTAHWSSSGWNDYFFGQVSPGSTWTLELRYNDST